MWEVERTMIVMDIWKTDGTVDKDENPRNTLGLLDNNLIGEVSELRRNILNSNPSLVYVYMENWLL